MTIRVLLIEDHASLRQAMSAVMDLEDDMDLPGMHGGGPKDSTSRQVDRDFYNTFDDDNDEDLD